MDNLMKSITWKDVEDMWFTPSMEGERFMVDGEEYKLEVFHDIGHPPGYTLVKVKDYRSG